MAQNSSTDRGYANYLDRDIDDPNAEIDLSYRVRVGEQIIRYFLFVCGFISVFTTIGILVTLVSQSTTIFTDPSWEGTNRSLHESIDDSQTTFAASVEGGTLGEDLLIRVQEEIMYVEQYFTNQVRQEVTGTGGGFDLFCSADETQRTDINNASRPITDEELAACEEIGRTPVAFRVGTDGIAITVNAANDFVQDVTLEELRIIFGDADTWADVRPEWPNEPIGRFIPGTDSGTFDFFVDVVYDGDPDDILTLDPITSESDEQLVRNVRENEFAIGFFGYSFYQNNRSGLNILSLDGVEASAETVEDGSYPLARPLFIYTAEDALERSNVAGYINYYLNQISTTDIIEEVGEFPASDEALAQARETFAELAGESLTEEGLLPAVTVSDLRGDILIAGSSTVAPITEVISERFIEEGFFPTLMVRRGENNTTPISHSAGTEIERGDIVGIFEFLTGTSWQPQIGNFGVLPLVNATLMTSLVAMLVAIPFGLGAAIYLSEYADRRVRSIVKPILEILAGIPTVVYGYFALTFMTPLLRSIIGEDIVQFYNTLSAGIVVGILIIPYMASLSEDALQAVPRALREASYGLGATRQETTVKVVLPAALSGIIAAFIVSVSRAVGETMIVAIAAGAGPRLTFNLFEGAQTMTGYIASISGGDVSYDSIDYNSIFAIGLVLFAITFLLNIISNAIIRRFRESY